MSEFLRLKIAIEAKSRHRPGILDYPGESQSADTIRVGTKYLLKKALAKSTVYGGGDPRHAADFHGSPASSAVLGDLHQAIVRQSARSFLSRYSRLAR